MATLLTSFVVTAASSMFTAAYIGQTGNPTSGSLRILIDVFTSATIGNVTTTNGYGGPSDAAIAYPWNQPIPLVNQLNSYAVSTPVWSVVTSSHAPSSLSDGRQQVELILDRANCADWLGIVIPANTSQSATVNIYEMS